MLRRLAHLVLVLALLCAWQGALEHPLVHVHAQSHAADADHDGPQDVPHACDACIAFAAFGAIANADAWPSPADTQAAFAAAGIDGSFLPRAPPAFRSQAPPLFS